MAINLTDYHGKVRKCEFCKIAEGMKSEAGCSHCFGRGYLAKCMVCDGKGQREEPMAGGPGFMKSTCGPCGGTGAFGVNKPDNWQDEPEAESVQA